MSNASLKEQLQAVAAQLTNQSRTDGKPKRNFQPVERHTKPKPNWLDYVRYGVELLRVYFPKGFYPASQVKPLKKGIKQDLVKRLSTMSMIVTDDKACMVKSLSYYVNMPSYHKSVIEGAVRIDLDGEAAGTVTTDEAQYSMEKYQTKLQAKNGLRDKKLQKNTNDQ